MRLSMSASACKQAQALPLVNYQGGLNIDNLRPWRRKDKVVIVMGATGTGKSRLAIDLATRLMDAEIVNSDKMQVYKGLDIVTNKVTNEECRGVPHHLLGIIDPDSNFTALDFCRHASFAVQSIADRGRLPIIAGGSNSYIEALIHDDPEFRSKYECCFLWVDVSLPVLHSLVSDRVDKMVDAGLVDEVRRIFDSEGNYSRGIRRAIGVPEMETFLRSEKFLNDDKFCQKLLEIAIAKIKDNTCELACRQLQKIHRLLYFRGWNLHRLDATEVFLKRGKDADEAWEKLVASPSFRIVRQFLRNTEYVTMNHVSASDAPTIIPAVATTTIPVEAVAAATR